MVLVRARIEGVDTSGSMDGRAGECEVRRGMGVVTRRVGLQLHHRTSPGVSEGRSNGWRKFNTEKQDGKSLSRPEKSACSFEMGSPPAGDVRRDAPAGNDKGVDAPRNGLGEASQSTSMHTAQDIESVVNEPAVKNAEKNRVETRCAGSGRKGARRKDGK